MLKDNLKHELEFGLAHAVPRTYLLPLPMTTVDKLSTSGTTFLAYQSWGISSRHFDSTP